MLSRKGLVSGLVPFLVGFLLTVVFGVIALGIIGLRNSSHEVPVPSVDFASMSFDVLNVTETRLSAEWDLAISIPKKRHGYYICYPGNITVSIFYKNVTLVNPSQQEYNNLFNNEPRIAVFADISGLIGKDIMKDINEKKEVKFRSEFFLTDCKQKKVALIRYACDEATLRFEPGSETKATVFSHPPKCINSYVTL